VASGYCTAEDIEGKFNRTELAKMTNQSSSDEIDSSVIDDSIEKTADIIDGYLESVYELPFNEDGNILKKINMGLAVYDIYEGSLNEIPDYVAKMESRARKELSDISRGLLKLKDADAEEEPVTGKVNQNRVDEVEPTITDELLSKMP
jgi:phage gp36-like protein